MVICGVLSNLLTRPIDHCWKYPTYNHTLLYHGSSIVVIALSQPLWNVLFMVVTIFLSLCQSIASFVKSITWWFCQQNLNVAKMTINCTIQATNSTLEFLKIHESMLFQTIVIHHELFPNFTTNLRGILWCIECQIYQIFKSLLSHNFIQTQIFYQVLIQH